MDRQACWRKVRNRKHIKQLVRQIPPQQPLSEPEPFDVKPLSWQSEEEKDLNERLLKIHTVIADMTLKKKMHLQCLRCLWEASSTDCRLVAAVAIGNAGIWPLRSTERSLSQSISKIRCLSLRNPENVLCTRLNEQRWSGKRCVSGEWGIVCL